jgi:hypothetical protein
MLKTAELFPIQQYLEEAQNPKLQDWTSYLSQATVDSARLEIDRPQDVLMYKQAYIVILFYGADGKLIKRDKTKWDDALNDQLVRLGVRAKTEDHEVMRFALSLQAALQSPLTRFGDGFYNKVLMYVMENSAFALIPDVARILTHIKRGPLQNVSPTATSCKDMINSAIRSRGVDLTKYLKYDTPSAERILARAVAQYLDERFSVTNRLKLGWS